ncbi:protein of unknown function [Magnetospirillum sp. XM-1]|nr:protein of unknown function [Magnetospirillum sp. XM-1]
MRDPPDGDLGIKICGRPIKGKIYSLGGAADFRHLGRMAEGEAWRLLRQDVLCINHFVGRQRPCRSRHGVEPKP